MCAGAIVQARLDRVVWGMTDPKRGGQTLFSILDHQQLNHRPEITTGILEEECTAVIREFFKERRAP